MRSQKIEKRTEYNITSDPIKFPSTQTEVKYNNIINAICLDNYNQALEILRLYKKENRGWRWLYSKIANFCLKCVENENFKKNESAVKEVKRIQAHIYFKLAKSCYLDKERSEALQYLKYLNPLQEYLSKTEKMRAFLWTFEIHNHNKNCEAADRTLQTIKKMLSSSSDNEKALVCDLANTYYEEGKKHLDNKEYSAAILDLDNAIKLNPEHKDAHILRGIVYFYKNDDENAIKYLEGMADGLADYYLMRIYLKQKNFDDARFCFRRIIYSKIENKQRIKVLSEWPVNSETKDYFDEFQEFINHAIKVATDSDLESIYYVRGEAYHQMGEYQAAIKDFERAIEKSGKNTNSAHYRYIGNIGTSYLCLGNFLAAIHYLDMAMKKCENKKTEISKFNYDTIKTRLEMASACQAATEGNFYAAVESFEKIKRGSSTPVILLTMSNAYVDRGKDRMMEQGLLSAAEADFKKALELNPNNINARYHLGCIQFQNKQYPQAEAGLTLAIAFLQLDVDSDLSRAYFYRGSARLWLMNWDEAEYDFENSLWIESNKINKSKECNDYISQSYHGLAIIYFRRKNFAIAIAYLNLALEQSPNLEISGISKKEILFGIREIKDDEKKTSCLEACLNPSTPYGKIMWKSKPYGMACCLTADTLQEVVKEIKKFGPPTLFMSIIFAIIISDNLAFKDYEKFADLKREMLDYIKLRANQAELLHQAKNPNHPLGRFFQCSEGGLASIFGKAHAERWIAEIDKRLEKLDYASDVCQTTQRLYPPVPPSPVYQANPVAPEEVTYVCPNKNQSTGALGDFTIFNKNPESNSLITYNTNYQSDITQTEEFAQQFPDVPTHALTPVYKAREDMVNAPVAGMKISR